MAGLQCHACGMHVGTDVALHQKPSICGMYPITSNGRQEIVIMMVSKSTIIADGIHPRHVFLFLWCMLLHLWIPCPHNVHRVLLFYGLLSQR